MHRLACFSAAAVIAAAPIFAIAADAPKPPAKPAAKEDTTPKSLGGANGWSAYSAGGKANLVCYVVGKPTRSEPADPKRSPVDLQVTHRPVEKALNVVSFELGYAAKSGSSADLDIDGKKFSLFTNKNAAWTSNAASDKIVTAALSKGKKAVIAATPERGANTTDTYILEGFARALALADKACGIKR